MSIFDGKIEVERLPTRFVGLIQRGVEALETIAKNGGGVVNLSEVVDELHAMTEKLDAIEEDLRIIQEQIAPPHSVGGSITFEGLTPQGGTTMYVVRDTQAPVAFTITPPTMVDARGRPVPPGTPLVYKVLSDPAPDSSSGSPVGPGVVMTYDQAADELHGQAGPFNDNEDGSPAVASVTVGVFLANGTMVGSFGAQFTITAGDPAALIGGGIAFDGLTEEPAPAAAPRRR